MIPEVNEDVTVVGGAFTLVGSGAERIVVDFVAFVKVEEIGADVNGSVAFDAGKTLLEKSLLAKIAAIVELTVGDVVDKVEELVVGVTSICFVEDREVGLLGGGGGFLDDKKLAELLLRGTLAKVNLDLLVLNEELCVILLPSKLFSSGLLFSPCDSFLSKMAVTMGLEELKVPL